MHASLRLVALAATFSSALAAYQGFNYGSTFTSGAPKQQSDFEAEFKTARDLAGAPNGGFTSARLYTTIQAATSNQPISAIPAAISTKTSLLLGIWCSAGEAIVANEIQALKSAITQYGTEFTKLVAGISVGSEDLYRISPTGLKNGENPGADPLTIARYIKEVRDAIAGTPLAGAPIGHVDTWTAWVNGSNQAVIDACDWVGVDAYPYFQETQANSIDNSKSLFNSALDATKAAVGGKPVWITETGYPVSGKTVGLAVPGLENAKIYWDEVGCPLFGSANVWWYTFQDAAPATPNPSFGIIGNSLTTTPLYDISCKNITKSNPAVSPSQSSGGGSSSTTSLPATKVASGSQGAGSATPSSKVSLDHSTFISTASKPTGTGLGTGGSETGSGSGADTTNLVPTGTPKPSASTVTNPNGAPTVSGSVGAAFAAVMAAILAL